MKPTELRSELNRRLRQARPDLAWERGIEAYRDETLRSVTRVAAGAFLQTLAREHLPASFWTDARREEAQEVGAQPRPMAGIIGRVSFPAVVDGSEPSFFAEIIASRDEFPDGHLHGLDEAGREAVAAAEIEARRVTGDSKPIHFRVQAPKDVLPISGPSCGLAAALAAVSLFEEIPVEDGIVATGRVGPGGVSDVGGLAEKARLRADARPLARMFVPTGTIEGDGLVPVPSLQAARQHLAEPDERAQREALREYLAQLSQDPALRQMNLQGLHGVRSGPHSTGLDLLDLAVPPSFEAESTAQVHDERRAQVLAEDTRPDRDEARREVLASHYRNVEALAHAGWGRWDKVSLDELLGRNHVLILGDAGMGKSVAIRLITLACCDDVAGARARSLMSPPDRVEQLNRLRSLVPLRLSFGRLAERLAANAKWTLADGVRAELRATDASLALVRAVDGALERGQCLLLLDGLDEAPVAQREHAARLIEDYVTRFPECRLVITTRPHGYRPRIAGLVHVKIRPYGDDERRLLVERMLRASGRLRGDGSTDAQTSTQAKGILSRIDADKKLRELTTNPLLLTLVAMLPQGSAVSHRVVVYENFVRTLVLTWAGQRQAPAQTDRGPSAEVLLAAWSAFAKVCVREEKRHGLKRARCLRILKRVADAPPEVVLERGLEDGLVREVGDDLIAFAHSSYGEFLAARTLTPPESIDGAGLRILEEVTQQNLSPLVLQLAAARLAVVEDAHEEVEALIDGLLALDREDTLDLEMRGLRLASGIIADRVPVTTAVRDRVLDGWLRLGERWAPSLCGEGFAELLAVLEEPRLRLEQLERILGLFEGQARDVRTQMIRLAATATRRSAAAQTVCRAVHGGAGPVSGLDEHLAARGLAHCGEWSDKVVAGLATYAEHEEPPYKVTTALVRSMPREFLAKVEARLGKLEGEFAQDDARRFQRTRTRGDEDIRLLALREARSAGLLQVLADRGGNSEKAILRHISQTDRASFEAIGALLASRSFCDGLLKDVLVPVAIEGDWAVSHLIGALKNVLPEDQPAAWQTTKRVLAEQPAAEDVLRRQLMNNDDGLRCVAAAVLFQAQPGDDAVSRALIKGCESPVRRWRRLCAGVILDDRAGNVADELLRAALLVELVDASDPPGTIRFAHSVSWWPPERQRALLSLLGDRSVAGAVRVAAAERLNAESAKEATTLATIRSLLGDADSGVRNRTACRLYDLGYLDEAIVGELIYRIADRKGGRHALDPWFRPDLPVDDLLKLASSVLTRAEQIDPQVAEHDEFRFRHIAIALIANALKASSSFIEPVLRAIESATPVAELVSSALDESTHGLPGLWETITARSAHAGLSATASLSYCRLLQWHSRPHPPAIERLETILLAPAPESGLDEWRRLNAARLLADAGRLEAAAQLWRGLLGGNYALLAAENLVERFGSGARPWIEGAVERMLAKANGEEAWPLKERLRLIRLALGLTIGTAQAVELALLVFREPCTHSVGVDLHPLEVDTESTSARKRVSLRDVDGFGAGDSHRFVLDLLLWHAPERVVPVLLDWLGQPERFTLAVKCLRHMGQCGGEVTAALYEAVASGDFGERHRAISLLEKGQAIDDRVVEILIQQMLGDGSHEPLESRSEHATVLLARCAASRPGVTKAIRTHLKGRRPGANSVLSEFLQHAGPCDADALELLLDLGMEEWWSRGVGPIYERWLEVTETGGHVAWQDELTQRFLERWHPADANATLEQDDIAAFLDVDPAMRATRLRSLLDPRIPIPACAAAVTLAGLGHFDESVELVAWALLDAPIDPEAEDRFHDDPAAPAALRLNQRVDLLLTLHKNSGPSDRLGRAIQAFADAPNLPLWRRRSVVDSLPVVSPWEGPTPEWVAKHLAAAPFEEIVGMGPEFVEGLELLPAVRARTLLTAIGVDDNPRFSRAMDALSSLIGAPGDSEPADDDAASHKTWRVPDLRDPTERTAFFDWAERLGELVALDEVLWSLGQLPESSLPRYRQAMSQGLADLGIELGAVLRRRPPTGPLAGPPHDRLVNFAREWLTHRLLKQARDLADTMDARARASSP